MGNKENYNRLLSKAMNLCSKQEKCISEIKKKISDWEGNEENSDKIIAELLKAKFIDEQRYARSFARQKFGINRWGKTKIRFMLKQKKISDRDIEQGLAEIKDSEYKKTLYELLQRKRKEVKGRNQWEIKAKLNKFAQGRGFEYDNINKVLDKIIS